MSESTGALTVRLLEGEQPTVKLSGVAAFHSKDRISEVFERLLGSGQCRIRLDLGEMAFIDSSGLSTLIKYAIRASEAGGFIQLVGTTPQVLRAVTLCGAAAFFAGISSTSGCLAAAPTYPADPFWHVSQFNMPATPEAVSEARGRVAEVARLLRLPEADVDDVKFALGEALANAIKHGCKYDESKGISVRCVAGVGRLTIEVTDPGKGFDPDRVPVPNVDSLLEGGMGIYLMRNLMDEVEFSFESGTTVRLVKHIRSRSRDARSTEDPDVAAAAR